MCGRLTQIFHRDELRTSLEEYLDIDLPSHNTYNVAPSEPLTVLLRDCLTQTLISKTHDWGMPSSWLSAPTNKKSSFPDKPSRKLLINKRIETVTEKPFFKQLFCNHRLAIPIGGWYEWKKSSHASGRHPYYITKKMPFFCGGIANTPPQATAIKDAKQSTSHAIIFTTMALAGLEDIHHRMPLLLDEKFLPLWLSGKALPEKTHREILSTQKTLATKLMARRVSTYVNAPRHKDKHCIENDRINHDAEELFLFKDSGMSS